MKRAFNYLAAQNPKLLQELWERHTAAGKEYRKHVEREKLLENIKPLADTRKLVKAITDNNWQSMGVTIGDDMTVERFVKVDSEIEIHVHRDKGDLYGVFRKINETRVEFLINELTGKNSLNVTLGIMVTNLDEIVKNVESCLQAGEDMGADEMRAIQTILKNAVTVLRYMEK